ncbi:hypothetical protein HGG78_18845 [Vibrio aestuarianus]|uniref:hypothetical protein n=1 Tax=Vibrio aestuarianus TaxID=28171 RepID=UPI00155901B5|nr:hypothetical protein [Vibrio aestuarianus]NGZ15762.1 hypothetical protein [Vibrio aestuarianus]NKZ51910.1 hypothetical protein [Vibrio aestuarianus]
MDKENKIYKNKIVIAALSVIALIDTAFAIDYFTTDHEARACIGTQYQALQGMMNDYDNSDSLSKIDLGKVIAQQTELIDEMKHSDEVAKRYCN